ncbi:hypothetical protein [Rhodovulum adriaticum]|uniref:Uncharacterized protein n=2 Tax=Rhodovulum adriaticum TaxID=35804 RepID=A0A4R2NY54_RHOAD|nr:hypothetical protein [Rhodovulum adriaticum]MBK1635230.1 hypothetical protein [Rhodovulum adriaticum]TCP26365.1 hypothetical protein EV656_102330 [Rhodovulum adriaticum]
MLTKSGLLALSFALVAGPAAAWQDMTRPHDPNTPAPQPVPHKVNYCPDGLQPVKFNGMISCGGTYQPRYIVVDSLEDVPADYAGRVYHLRHGNPGRQELQ